MHKNYIKGRNALLLETPLSWKTNQIFKTNIHVILKIYISHLRTRLKGSRQKASRPNRAIPARHGYRLDDQKLFFCSMHHLPKNNKCPY